MKQQLTWPSKSNASPFTSLPLSTPTRTLHAPPQQKLTRHHINTHNLFSALPHDLVTRISASFSHRDLTAASLVCKPWKDALRPLREAMLLLLWGKKFKHGKGGVKVNLKKALESFLKGAERGSSLAMVDAGLIYWEMGRREDGIRFYRMAAELGDVSGMCNLGIAFLQLTFCARPFNRDGCMNAADSANIREAVRWLLKSAYAGHARAQYQLALCLHYGRGIERNLCKAARWYLRAAEGGYVRAMYNVSLCFSSGEGFEQSHPQAKKWMKRAADHGHSRGQFEHGLNLCTEGEMMKAVVYLELATRAGEVSASYVRDVILPTLSAASRDQAMLLADKWRALRSSR